MKKNWRKYIIAFFSVIIIRLLPFRAPNVEPMMAVMAPFGKVYGGMVSFMFGALGIIVYDIFTSGIGIWTFITALMYGLVGYGAQIYLKNRSGWRNYARFAIIATIVYDGLTGLTIGPLFFHQSFMISLVGQIPFTLLHLLGNVSFAIILSPVIERWITAEEGSVVFSKFRKVGIIS